MHAMQVCKYRRRSTTRSSACTSRSVGRLLGLELCVRLLRDDGVASLCRLRCDVGEDALLLGREARERRLV